MKLFDIDNPFMIKMGHVADLLIVNVLFVLCSIPVITGGAAFAGMQKVCMMKVLADDEPIIRTFFRGFKSNFKYASIVWFANILLTALPVLYLQFVGIYFSGMILRIVNCVMLILLFLFNGIFNYMIMLIVRYDNKLMEHLKNAWLLSMGFLPRTLAVVAINIIPLVLAYINLDFFFRTVIIWLLVGLSAIRYFSCRILKVVIYRLEEQRA